MELAAGSTQNSFEQYQAIAEASPQGWSSRLILQKGGSIKVQSLFDRFISWASGTIEDEDRAIVADFKQRFLQKYGKEITNFAFSQHELETQALTIDRVKQIIDTTNAIRKQDLLDEREAIISKIESKIKACKIALQDLETIDKKIGLKYSQRSSLYPTYATQWTEEYQRNSKSISKDVTDAIQRIRQEIETAKQLRQAQELQLKRSDSVNCAIKNLEANNQCLQWVLKNLQQAEKRCKNVLGVGVEGQTGGVSEELLAGVEEGDDTKFISDDFPQPDIYGKLLGDLSKKQFNAWEGAYVNFSLEQQFPDLISKQQTTGQLSRPLPQRSNGLVGLDNPTGNCAVNTSLQVLKETLQSVLCSSSSKKTLEQEKIEQSLQAKMPFLWKFIHNEIKTSGNCQELHREIARILTSSYWYSLRSRGIATASIEKGYFYGSYSPCIIPIVLQELGIPPIYFQKISSLGKQEIHSLQALQLENVRAATVKESITSEYKPEPPLPEVLRVSLQDCTVDNTFDTIQFHDGSHTITYEVKSMVLEGSGHEYALIKKDDGWYEVNDQEIYRIPRAWEEELKKYASTKTSFVVYEKQQKVAANTPNQLIVTTAVALDENDLCDQMEQGLQWLSGSAALPSNISIIQQHYKTEHAGFFETQVATLLNKKGKLEDTRKKQADKKAKVQRPIQTSTKIFSTNTSSETLTLKRRLISYLQHDSPIAPFFSKERRN